MAFELTTEQLQPYLLELHYQRPLFDDMMWITCTGTASKAFRRVFPKEQINLKEFFGVLLLTQSNRLLGASIVSVGNTTGVIVNFKEIFQLALLTNASAIIVGHNHPSGMLKISDSDREQTDKMLRLGKLMGITMLDHIIITDESYTSLADEGEL